MMQDIKVWAIGVCFAMVACSIATMLLPQSNLRKIYQLLISIFFLCCLILPLLDMEFDPNALIDPGTAQQSEEIADKVKEITENQVYRQASDNIHSLAQEELAKLQIPYEKIDVTVNTEEENGILFIEIHIVLLQQFSIKEQEIIKAMEQSLGITPTVSYTQEVEQSAAES